MTPKEAFKLGFLQKCAADNLSEEEIIARVHQAKFMAKQALGEGLMTTGLGLALAAPPLLGVAGGALLSDATSQNYDINEAKRREELAEYQRALKAMQAMHVKNHPTV